MRVLNYLEFATRLERSGIYTAADQQRKALAGSSIEVVTDPWIGDGGVDRIPAGLRHGRVFDRYDIAHLHLFGPASVAVARHANRTGRPLILHAHTLRENTEGSWRGTELIGGPLERYLRWFYSQADLVLCPSHYAADRLREYPVEAPMEVVTNGVDRKALEGFSDLREPYRTKYDLDGIVVFAVGNVFERKGLTTFCRLAQHTDHRFVWFGPYDTGPHASTAVRRWVGSPPDNVQFTGWIDDIRGAYAAGDIYLFPTKNETQGITALEAMACGKAVVLRDIPVFDEYFTDGEDCLKCGSFGEFREAIDRLAADPALRERLGEAAKRTAADHDLAHLGDRLESIYRRLDPADTTH